MLAPLYLELMVAFGKQPRSNNNYFLETFPLPVSLSIPAASYHLSLYLSIYVSLHSFTPSPASFIHPRIHLAHPSFCLEF